MLPHPQNHIVQMNCNVLRFLSGFCRSLHPRKEVIQPHLPIRLPCYDFTPSGAPNSHGVTGGVYKARERIHRGMLIRDY